MRIKRCIICANPFTPKRRDARYCRPYCRLKAFRHRHGILQRRADRDLRSCLLSVSGGRLSAASAKARLGLYDLSGIKIEKGIRKIIESM